MDIKARVVALVACVAFVTGAAAHAQCNDISVEIEQCMAHVGCACPSEPFTGCPDHMIFGTTRPHVIDGVFELTVISHTPCYISKKCGPETPGACGPANPRVTSGEASETGQFFQYIRLQLCGIIT